MTKFAWIGYNDENPAQRAIEWLRESEHWSQRAFLIPQKQWSDSILDEYAANGNVGSDLGKQAEPGGPVFCFGPTLKLLEQAVRVSTDRTVLLEWSAPRVRGWAAATGAMHLVTGEVEPAPDGDALESLQELADIGFMRSEPFYKAKRVGPVDALKSAGYDLYYVQTYLIGHGMDHKDAQAAEKYFDKPAFDWPPE